MPEIRASLTTDLHRKLKAEAAREGVHLKELIAQVLEKHVNSQGGTKKPR
jgi:predicted HicB family RNase H-like nuclease